LTFPEILVIALSLAGAAVVFLVLFLVSGEKKKKSELEGLPSRESSESWALKVERSVSGKYWATPFGDSMKPTLKER